MAIVTHDTYLSSVRAWLLIPALLSVTPLSLAAQSDPTAVATGRTSRRALLAVIGVLVGGTSGALLHRDGSGTACRACTIGGGALIGGVAGLLVGREVDQMYAVRYRGVPRLRIPFVEQPLDGDPLVLAARDTLLAVATSTGVTILFSTDVLLVRGRRANGIRGISALELTSRTHAMAVATPTGLSLYPSIRGAGVLLREGTIQAATASDDHVFFALGPRIESAPLDGDSAGIWPGLYAGAGPEGVFVIDPSTAPLRTIGLAFDLGFAATLLSRDGYTYILDRRTSSVRRISTPTTR